MTAFLYTRLAAGGIKKNRHIYLPYILAFSGMIMMYYIVSFLAVSKFVLTMRGGDIMQMLLSMGCGVMVAFSAVFLFYTNSFLIRRRKTEFGLYNILGMDKRNIARILLWETLIIYAVSEICGIGCGILFSKLCELLLTKMMGGEAAYAFNVEAESVIRAAAYYAVIFILILINALRQIHLSNPIELLHSENMGERPPKGNPLLALSGAVLLGIAYYMAITIKNPLYAIFTFFAAVLMVIAATYLLFISGSVVICRLLRKNKKYYYKSNHFVSVSQMAYRMKRSGAGLASICILSTMVLVTLSSTTCLYAGSEKVLRSRYPRNIAVDIYSTDKSFTELIHSAVNSTLEEFAEAPENILHYSFLDISGAFEGNKVILDPDKREELSNSVNPDIRQIFFVTADDYNRLMNKNEVLEDGEAIIYSTKESYKYDTINIEKYGTFKIRSAAKDFEDGIAGPMVSVPAVYLFVKDESVVKEIYDLQLGIYGKDSSSMHDYYGFDLSCGDEKQIEISNEINSRIAAVKKENPDLWKGVSVDSSAHDRSEFYALYGGLFFLGIVLGSVFICAAVLIMYYKQISEGFEDKAGFLILRKVGMTKKEIRQSINSQVLTVFFLPLAAAGMHMCFAFPIISRLLMLFGLDDTVFLAVVTLFCFGAFAVLYIAAYKLTSKSYYRIVSDDNE